MSFVVVNVAGTTAYREQCFTAIKLVLSLWYFALGDSDFERLGLSRAAGGPSFTPRRCGIEVIVMPQSARAF